MVIILFFVWLSFINPIKVYSSNVGTSLFNNKRIKCECWSESDLAKLRARRVFESLALPTPLPHNINTRYIRKVINYFGKTLNSTKYQNDLQTAKILKESLADFLGGHLRYQILPASRFAYYAGYVSYRNVRDLHDFFDDIKKYLNTQGSGWKVPPRIPSWTRMAVAKILVDRSLLHDACEKLIYKRDSNSCIHLPKPKLDDDKDPSAIALPFKSNGLYGLRSARSEDIVLKYYTTASKCILRNSPPKCRHTDFEAFNNDLWHWMKRDVAPHLGKEVLFTAYGGILRVAAAVQTYGKGLARRNLFESDGFDVWRSWKGINNNYVYMDYDWTPQIYVIFVVIAALAICLFQICQHYVFTKSCNCSSFPTKKFSRREHPTEVAYTAVDSNIPAILPRHPQSAVLMSEQKRTRLKSSKSKATSLESFTNQRVYDLNENTEKIMSIILSDEERHAAGVSMEPSVQEILSDESEDRDMSMNEETFVGRSGSPPKIRPEISQSFASFPRIRKEQVPEFSSTYSYSEAGRSRRAASESAWSASDSTGSTSSSRTCRSGRPRSSSGPRGAIHRAPDCSTSRQTSRQPPKGTTIN